MLTKEEIINKCEELVGNSGNLLYVTKFGSHLYGTFNENSDLDIRGIFLPNFESLLMNNEIKHITYSSGNNTDKNSSDDIDITLYSLQYFLKLLRKGDTGALDLLFSYTNNYSVLKRHTIISRIVENRSSLIDIKNCDAYVNYAISQARKYCIKGSRFGVLKNIHGFLTELKENDSFFVSSTIEDIEEELLRKFSDNSYCFLKKSNNIWYLCVCGSMHQLNTTLPEFFSRIAKQCEKYGVRTQSALDSNSIDWKAISHAIRVIYQCKELFSNGTITFPLKNCEEIKQIKQGLLHYKDVEELILTGLDEVKQLKENCTLDWNYNEEYLIELLKGCY